MVIETPPNVLGFVNDHWFRYVVDFGTLGPDKGQGGKLLMLPPGYDGDVPEGYHVARTNTYGNWVLWPGYQKDGSTADAVNTTKELFRIYIGIIKGQEFAPGERMKAILEAAAKAGSVTVKTVISKPRDERVYWYPGESHWQTAFPGGAYTCELDGVTLHTIRSAFHFYATGITRAMALKKVGKGSHYAFTYLDFNGNPLDGAKTYRVNIPKDVPAKDFWSFTLYDNQTRSMLQTDAQFPAIGSNDSDVVQNEDGSYDVYFGPAAPEGKQSNWVQTVPGKGWNTIFRLYGPLESWFDQTWFDQT